MNNLLPIPGEKWEHYKGGTYEVISLATHTESNEKLVIYKSLNFGSIFARPISIWQETVLNEMGEQIERFKRCK